MRGAALLMAALLALPAHAADEFIREGSDSWGSRIASLWGLPGFGQSIAVIVAVGDYRNGWTKLEAPARDAARMRQFLIDEAGFDRVYTFVDAEATLPALRELMLEELPRITGPNDRVLFYYSGHGAQKEEFGGKLIGYLPLQNSAKDGWSSMIDMRDMERWWGAVANARQSLFILDACFSGLGMQSKSGSLRERTLSELSRRGHHLITAGSQNQESFASMSRWGGSLFTTALLEGMRGAADASRRGLPADGIVSLKELWDYVGARIRSETPPEALTPQLAGFEFNAEGEFFFLTRAMPPENVTLPLPGTPTEDVISKGDPTTDAVRRPEPDESYIAVLSSKDRVNSRGQPLSEVAAILQQDRANFHKFGLRDPADGLDSYFTSLETRAEIAAMLERGSIENSLAARIPYEDVAVRVDIFKRGGNPFIAVSPQQ